MLANVMFAKVYNNVITIIKRFAISGDAYFIAKVYNKIITKDVIIIKSSYNENNGDDEDNENVIIFASYSYIKFIALFKYLTLYYISNFDL